MAVADDMSLLAGEYELGLLDREERDRVARRIVTDADLAAEHAFWQRHLLALIGRVPSVAPSPRVKAGLEERLFGIEERTLWQDLLAPEHRGILVLVVGAKVAAIGVLLALLL
ncbi:hypothetical protein [Roseivivax marinus]|uniref:hypothetical protein n=1 Tax=Roseivivax marinus TaxID=1379903 RepID=UPI00273F59B3|nr:hypothetical protein [Roseivivax marinus]